MRVSPAVSRTNEHSGAHVPGTEVGLPGRARSLDLRPFSQLVADQRHRVDQAADRFDDSDAVDVVVVANDARRRLLMLERHQLCPVDVTQ